MTSFRQFEANRRNALKSTGPRTADGKQRSRCNAVRHGLTAETVISALEDSEDYKAFETAITADYDAQSAVERELVLRLASLLWRLRRATIMETGLFELEGEQQDKLNEAAEAHVDSAEVIHAKFGRAEHTRAVAARSANSITSDATTIPAPRRAVTIQLSTWPDAFLGLADLPSYPTPDTWVTLFAFEGGRC